MHLTLNTFFALISIRSRHSDDPPHDIHTISLQHLLRQYVNVMAEGIGRRDEPQAGAEAGIEGAGAAWHAAGVMLPAISHEHNL
jgi:hypothetical protein